MPGSAAERVPHCAADRFAAGTRRYFVASVLFNDEHRVPAFTRELLKLVRLLKGHPLFVSIYEASSTDGTNAALQPLSQVLEQIGVAHVVQHGLEQAIPRLRLGHSLACSRYYGYQRVVARPSRHGPATAPRLILPTEVCAQIAFGESKEHFVASLRNKAMEPLYNEDTTWIYFDKVPNPFRPPSSAPVPPTHAGVRAAAIYAADSMNTLLPRCR